MDKIARLRQEIERHLNSAIEHQNANPDMPKHKWYLYEGAKELCTDLLGYLDDTLMEEPDKSLEEEMKRFIDAHYHTRFDETLENGNDPLTVFDFEDIARHFAEWQKSQMLKDAVEGIARPDDCEIWVNLVGYGYKFRDGEKVRIVVLKDESK